LLLQTTDIGGITMKLMLLLSLTVLLSACSPSKIAVRSLDETLIDAAEKAKKAGASELTVEVSVTSGFAGKADVPISVVALGGEASLSKATKLTVKFSSLANWQIPLELKATSPTLYLLDQSTFKLQSLEPQK
jgi:hypothetical protein